MIQLNYFHFSILLFGQSNKKIIVIIFGPNFRIEIRGQFVNFKNFEGSNYNF